MCLRHSVIFRHVTLIRLLPNRERILLVFVPPEGGVANGGREGHTIRNDDVGLVMCANLQG